MNTERYRELFLAESREHLGAAHELLGRLSADTQDVELLRELLRHAHSLKGMAATMGRQAMVELAHALEDLCEELLRAPTPAETYPARLLEEALLCLERQIDAYGGAAPPPAGSSADLARELRGLAERLGASDATSTTGRSADAVSEPPSLDAGRWWVSLQLAAGEHRTARPTVETLRSLAGIGRVERVAPPTLSGEPLRFDGRLELLLSSDGPRERIEAALAGLTDVERFDIEAAPSGAQEPAEDGGGTRWARVRADLLDDLTGLALDLMLEQGRLRTGSSTASAGPQRQLERSEFLVKRIYGRLMEMRLTSFSAAAERLRQSVDRLSDRLAKPLRFEIEGVDTRLDRSLIEALLDPLLHMVRNAVDHGFEAPEERRNAGKSEEGRLVLSLRRTGDRLLIALQDDGRGICPERLREAAAARGFIDRETARELGDEEAWMLITLPAFSTARQLTDLSGRGVGMDVVRNRVERVGGRLAIRSWPGAGTRIELRLPLTVALVRSLMLRCGGELFALPASTVRATRRLAGDAVAGSVTLAGRLGVDSPAPADSSGSLLQLEREGGTLELQVDEVLGVREVVVRPLGPPLAGLQPYAGAALLEDGTIALVLDPEQL